MRIPRLFVEPEGISQEGNGVTIGNRDQVHQIARVLRLKPPARLDLLDGRGNLFKCRLETLSADKAELTIVERRGAPQPDLPSIRVFLPMIKPARFEWAVEKLTELGVSTIVPFYSERTVVKIAEGSDGVSGAKAARWKAIAREAAEQCERVTIPNLVAPIAFSTLVARLNEEKPELALLLAERRAARPIKELAAESARLHTSHIEIVVGPEGGFTDEEFNLASESILTFVTLGERILRSETAAIYAVSLFTTL